MLRADGSYLGLPLTAGQLTKIMIRSFSLLPRDRLLSALWTPLCVQPKVSRPRATDLLAYTPQTGSMLAAGQKLTSHKADREASQSQGSSLCSLPERAEIVAQQKCEPGGVVRAQAFRILSLAHLPMPDPEGVVQGQLWSQFSEAAEHLGCQ